ncbi:MAG: NAD(P)-dependent oxidoreductase, partial [Pseudomonadales bacterium]|nr:NAD(P)-dependent oxidoreductase [Pseudomonadales bacterium]
VEPASLNQISGTKTDAWEFDLTYDGHRFQSLQELADLLVKRHVMNGAAGEALTWLHRQVLLTKDFDLQERRVVVFGAGAEMAATKLFLEAGANVLWLDLVSPPEDLVAENFKGTLFWPAESLDLLVEPEKVLATILGFAADDRVDLCLYAYAPGQARELRLSGTMNTIVEALPQSLVASVTMLVSPTTTSELGAEDLADIENRRRDAPLWERTLGSTGMMGKPGIAACRYASVTRTVVNIQGTSYQAAQYLGKLMAAESWHTRGYRVSANTAPITQTRSLDHPVFDAAFGGARALQVETFTPEQSQTVNGLLAIHDWLNPDHSPPGRARVHGGIHTLPYPLDKALRIAAAIGFARSPSLLKGLFR